MQRLVGPAAVRYLVENAASMLQIHLDAFCQLLRIPADHHGRYWGGPRSSGQISCPNEGPKASLKTSVILKAKRIIM